VSASSTTHGPQIAAALLNRTVTAAQSVPANYPRLYRTGFVISSGGSVNVAASGELLVL